MDSGTESLAILDTLLKEFFDYKTTNERKQEIETVLGEFGNQRDAWKHCIYYLNHTANHYVCMFCLATLEKIITKQWLQLMWEERSQLRTLLYQYTLQRHALVPVFIRNKLLKLVVDIARLDWPHFYPDFFTSILTLMDGADSKILGLAFLQTASEELICPREDLSASRKEELKRLFLAHIPQVFNTITGVLDEAKNKGDGENPVVLAALQALSHLFSWIPLADVNSLPLLSLITHFASQQDASGLHGLSALNELLYNNCVPGTFQNSLLSLCVHNNSLLRAALTTLTTNMGTIDPEYMSKLTEMTRLCVSVHWHRVESSPGFPVLEFLSSLFQFTFQQPSLEGFYMTLDIWNSLLDYLQLKDTSHIAKYEEVLVTLVHALLKKLQGHRDLDNEMLDNNEESERQKFLRQCIEVIAKVAELAPTQTCTLVLECWQPLMSQYSSLLCGGTANENLGDNGEWIDDCSALTQCVARLYSQMLAAAVPHNLASLFANLAAQATQARLHERQLYHTISPHLIELHSQIIAGLNACMCESIVETSLSAVLPLLIEPTAPKLQHSSAHVLNTICLQRAPQRSLDQLYTLFTTNISHLPKDTLSVVYCALVRCLLSWKWDSDSTRVQLLAGLIETMTPSGGPMQLQDLSHITAVLLHAKPDTSSSKKLLFTAVQPVLQQVLNDFPRILKTKPEQCNAMLTLFLEAFRTLQHQMGAQFTQRAVHTFISSFTQCEISEISCGVDKLLQLLTLVIEQPAASFKHFVPSCIALCLENILPSVTEATSGTIKPPLYHLLSSLVMHKWQYFYQGAVQDCQPVLEHGDQLAAILTAFGQSLTQQDISIFSQNLQALESINHKWKLYHKEMFRVQFLALLLTVLLTTLINKSHALLSDEIATAIYNMAAVNFDTFFNSFLPTFLSQTSGLDENQRDILKKNIKPDTDLPSFTQNIFRLANDVRCYRLCNT
ncbi:exportin-6 [Cimex lectularius]|uniref:Exportin-1/Importin-beta-like domain-containing protein n=1 Tax=Cimex lectularius TaxID=79782 RepID=A0A8I6RMF3_CIMLE|nr:exportin-6 [Cimex lectularius]